MSLVIDNVRSEDDELWICAGGAKRTLYIVRAELSLVQRRHRAMLLDQKLILQDLRMPAKEVSRSHDQQCAMVFRQNIIFHYLRIPLLALGLIRREILGSSDLVPIAGRASHEETNLTLAVMFQVRFAHSFVNPAIAGDTGGTDAIILRQTGAALIGSYRLSLLIQIASPYAG
jgi:hypothetical protein